MANATRETCHLVPIERVRIVSATSPSSGSSSEPDFKHLKKVASLNSYASGFYDTPRLPMKRRVNPDSLASRLEPNLVLEMNALIQSGNKEMPSFAIRKDLQERYQIDRRHIYDYFHSMGLRVVKHDKHNNLAGPLNRSRTTKPRPIRQAPCRELHVPQEIRRDSSAPRVSLNVINRARKLSKSHPQVSAPSFDQTMLRKHSDDRFIDILRCSVSLEIDENTKSHDIPSIIPLDDELALVGSICDTSYSCPAKIILDQIPPLYDVKKASTVTPRNITPCYSPPVHRHLDDDLILPFGCSLSHSERLSIYKFLDSNLPPSRGIEESVGSYKSYMKERSRLYFERFFSKFPDTTNITQDQTREPPNCFADAARDSVDFREWLLRVPSDNCSSIPPLDVDPHVNRETNTLPCTPRKLGDTYQCGVSSVNISAGSGSPFSFSFPVDGDDCDLHALFPPCDTFIDTNITLGSPVIHSQVAEPLSSIFDNRSEPFDVRDRPETLYTFTDRPSPLQLQSQIHLTKKSFMNISDSHSKRFDEETILAPTMTLSHRLRSEQLPSIGHDPIPLTLSPIFAAVSGHGEYSRPRVPHSSLSSYPAFNMVSPAHGRKRVRSYSFNPIPARPRTISAGGGI